jgi:GT2 family glycosyltransferase
LEAEHPSLVVVENPGRIVSTGLNIAVARSKGDIIIRIDGHALIAANFVTQSIALLAAHPEAWGVGGPIRHAATTTLGKAVAVAMSHPLGVGNARHRYREFEGYVESAQFPAIRRWVFDRIGMFDERLVRNQDDEFNYRIRRAGGKIYVSPRVQYSYFVRERLGQLFKQYFQYGFWRIPVIEKHRRPTTLRQMAPTLFYMACVLLGLAGWWWREPALAVILPGSYAAALFLAGVAAVRRNDLRVSSCVPVTIATMHAGYALGLAYGILMRFFRADAWSTQGKMATISR